MNFVKGKTEECQFTRKKNPKDAKKHYEFLTRQLECCERFTTNSQKIAEELKKRLGADWKEIVRDAEIYVRNLVQGVMDGLDVKKLQNGEIDGLEVKKLVKNLIDKSNEKEAVKGRRDGAALNELVNNVINEVK